jgi:outer membrane protein insertion porin family
MNLRKLSPTVFAFCVLSVAPAVSHGQLAPPIPPPAQAPAQAPVGPIVRSIDVQYAGASTISKEKILANMRTRVGRPYSEQVVEEDIRNLYNTGNIANVRIFGEQLTDGVKVIVVLQSKSQIAEVRIEGVTKFKQSAIRKLIGGKPGDVLNEASLETDKQKIIAYYAGKGFNEVDVSYTVNVNEKTGTASVLFTINEGGKSAIQSVTYQGNHAITKPELTKVVKTQHKGLLNIFSSTAGKLNGDLLEEDVTAIKDLYQSKGYMDVLVAPPRVDRHNGKVDVTFIITEGPQYHVGKVTYTGAKVLTVDEISKKAKIKPGAVYSPQAVRADVKTIQDLYGSHGYVDFQAGANSIPAPDHSFDVVFNLDEGVQSYLEHINISGNVRTKDKVIRREFALTPGDVFNTVRVDASKQRLMNLNYFAKVDTYPEDTLIPGRKDLNVLVEEKRTGSFNFGAGFSSIDSLLGFAEITQGNFDITRWPYFTGGGQKFRIRIQYGTERQDFIMSLTEPYFLDRQIAVGAELFYSKLDYISTEYDERRYGFDITARKRLGEFLSGRAEYQLQEIGILDVASDASPQIMAEDFSRLESKISVGLTYDSRDSVFLSRKGMRIDASAYIVGGPLGGQTNIYGFDLEASKYILLPWDTILTFNGEVGAVSTWDGGDQVPLWDRLYLGGANNLRGFKFHDVGPKDDTSEPLGGNTLARLTVEYTFPIMDKVRGAIFYDVGFVNSGSYDFGTQDINSDFGIGIRLDLPIGPVRIDYGIPIQKDNFSSSSGQFNFNIGYQF